MSESKHYWDYLKLDTLIELQKGFDVHEDDLLPDELHFIIVHQVYELWFKLALRSMRLARDHLAAPKVAEETIPHVVHHVRRINAIFKQAVDQFEIMETLTPQDFLGFRDKLTPASGFQSFQMRELEIVMGLDEAKRIHYGKVDPIEHIRQHAQTSAAGKVAWAHITAAREEQTLLHALDNWLYRTPIQGSGPDHEEDDQNVITFLESYLEALAAYQRAGLSKLVAALGQGHKEQLEPRFKDIYDSARTFLFATDVDKDHQRRVRRCRAALLFIESYRTLPLLAWPRLLLDVIVEMEEQLVLFRGRHVRMVERLIGRRVGSGGSSGVDYLDKTLKYRVFRDLWAIRTVLLPKRDLPPLLNPEIYGFASTGSSDLDSSAS